MKTRAKVILCCALSALALLLAMGVGSVAIAPMDTVRIIASRLGQTTLPEALSTKAGILWGLRMPRALMAFLVGAALASSGAVMQSVLRNPLASSYTLGVSSGASLTAAFTMVLGWHFLGGVTLPAMGFAGGLATVFLALALTARFDRGLSNHTVILTGMVLSLFVNAVLTVITSLSSDHLKQLIFWQMGSFSGRSFGECGVMAIVLVLGLTVLLRYAPEMDLLSFGEEQALSAGVEIRHVKTLLISLCALLTGAAVSFVGVIGFVDLIAPHVTRRVFGSRHRLVLPMSAVFGGGFMALADLLSRTVLSPRELPVGAVTALIGAPFFAYVYFRREDRKC